MKAHLILEELVRRYQKNLQLNLRDDSFEAQNKAIDDVCRFKAYNCTRRAGKSVGMAIELLETAINEPNTRQLYMALSLDSAKEIIWDVLIDLLDKNFVDYHANAVKGILQLDNGSKIRLFGADASYKEMRKILGQKLRRVVIDEAGSFTIDMSKMIYQVIMPALADLEGDIILAGTCEKIPNTFFEKVTEKVEPGWSVHKWTAYDNPHMKEQWTREIDRILKTNPKAKDASWFKTHYLNEWCTDDDLMIIKMNDHNFVDELPKGEWRYVLGVDLGYNDDTAFSVCAFSPNSRHCYIVETYKSPEFDFTDTARAITSFQSKYPFYKIIIDGANKQGVQELRNRFGLPLDIAEKQDKAIFLRILRDELIQGYVYLIKDKTNELQTEWHQLQWKDLDKDKEDYRCQNHLSDATLYAWRELYHYTYREPDREIDRDSDEFMDRLEEIEAEEMLKEDDWWEN